MTTGSSVLVRNLRRAGGRYVAQAPTYRLVVHDEDDLTYRRAERELVGWIERSWPARGIRVVELTPTAHRLRQRVSA